MSDKVVAYSWGVFIRKDSGGEILAFRSEGGQAVFWNRDSAWAFAREARQNKLRAVTRRVAVIEGWQ